MHVHIAHNKPLPFFLHFRHLLNKKMVSPQTLQISIPKKSIPSSSSSISNPRISFSTEILAGKNSISIEDEDKDHSTESEPERTLNTGEFEFLSGGLTNMIAADELFCEWKLLPFRQMQQSDHYKPNKISLKSENLEKGCEKTEQINKEASRISCFLDDDPSPRPPTCTVLWKELLRLRKQRASTLSPSSSSSSSSSRSSKSETSSANAGKESGKNKEKVVVKRIERAVERTRQASSIKIRPVFDLAVCTQRKSNVSPSFYSRKGNLER